MVLEDSQESPGLQGDQAINPKGNQPEYSLEGLLLKLQYCGHLMKRANSLEKILMLKEALGTTDIVPGGAGSRASVHLDPFAH